MAEFQNNKPHGVTKDLRGKKFGKLVVLFFDEASGRRHRWICRCECGDITSVFGEHLLSGHNSGRKCVHARHGMCKSLCYKIWNGVIQRCTNTRNNAFGRYGGRGILVCPRWRKFENFLADMGDPPTPQHSIDRIDNDGNYEPGNCRWATEFEQKRNTRRNRFFTYKGETLCLKDWSRRIGIDDMSLLWRIEHWPLERALGTPKQTIQSGKWRSE